MEKIKILLAEDELSLARMIKDGLEANNFLVTHVTNGAMALTEFFNRQPDICVFDVSMPAMDGFSLTREIRQKNTDIPVIFLTAKTLTEDVVAGFGAGGNDYLKKPFSMAELVVRINALLNRMQVKDLHHQGEMICNVGAYHFNFSAQTLSFESNTIKLTFREASLLKLLVENKNQVLYRKSALDEIWGADSFFNGRSMDVFITKLRKYLKSDSNIEIVNIRGIGYKLIVS